MSKTVLIPAGYRVEVTSWENDGDNYNTKSISGIKSESAVQFVVDICKLHKSEDDPLNPGFGNLYEPEDDEIEQFKEAVKDLIENHVGDFPDEYCRDFEGLREGLIWDLGLIGDFYTRVAQKICVQFFPEDVEVDDLTAKFV